MVNEFPKIPNAKALEDIDYQKIYNYQKNFSKRLENCLIEKDDLVSKA